MLRQLNSQQRLPKVQSVQSTIQPVRAFFYSFRVRFKSRMFLIALVRAEM